MIFKYLLSLCLMGSVALGAGDGEERKNEPEEGTPSYLNGLKTSAAKDLAQLHLDYREARDSYYSLQAQDDRDAALPLLKEAVWRRIEIFQAQMQAIDIGAAPLVLREAYIVALLIDLNRLTGSFKPYKDELNWHLPSEPGIQDSSYKEDRLLMAMSIFRNLFRQKPNARLDFGIFSDIHDSLLLENPLLTLISILKNLGILDEKTHADLLALCKSANRGNMEVTLKQTLDIIGQLVTPENLWIQNGNEFATIVYGIFLQINESDERVMELVNAQDAVVYNMLYYCVLSQNHLIKRQNFLNFFQNSPASARALFVKLVFKSRECTNHFILLFDLVGVDAFLEFLSVQSSSNRNTLVIPLHCNRVSVFKQLLELAKAHPEFAAKLRSQYRYLLDDLRNLKSSVIKKETQDAINALIDFIDHPGKSDEGCGMLSLSSIDGDDDDDNEGSSNYDGRPVIYIDGSSLLNNNGGSNSASKDQGASSGDSHSSKKAASSVYETQFAKFGDSAHRTLLSLIGY